MGRQIVFFLKSKPVFPEKFWQRTKTGIEGKHGKKKNQASALSKITAECIQLHFDRKASAVLVLA